MKYLFFLLINFSLLAADWPQWRYGSNHGASSSEELSMDLKEDWSLVFSERKQTWDDPLNNDVMTFDRIFEPVINKGRMFIAFNDSDKLIAVDINSGKLLWTFYAEGPIRLSPAAWKDKVFFTCDDGRLYCLNAVSGKKEWTVNGAPYSRKSLGNERVISAWPARGGVVIDNDRLYFAASIWPFMGTFIYCINPENGKQHWINSGSGFNYIKQPHGAPSFAGVAPQGTLGIMGDKLVIPGGRSRPAFYKKDNGEMEYFLHTGKGTGGSFVCSNNDTAFVHTRIKGVAQVSLKKSKFKSKFNQPVIDKDLVYAWSKGKLNIYKSDKSIKSESLSKCEDLIKCGNFLYAAAEGGISIHEASSLKKKGFIPCKENIQRLLAASGRLFAVTLDGKIISFAKSGKQKIIAQEKHALDSVNEDLEVLKWVKDKKGYALLSKVGYKTILTLLNKTDLKLTVLETDKDKIDQWRKKLDSAGVYGKRVAVNFGTFADYAPPAYMFNLIISGEDNNLKQAWKSLRPYGGVLQMTNHKDFKSAPEGMKKIVQGKSLILIKEGALPGSGDWTHMYGDAGNSVKSDDKLVKLPLGVLWFGGNTNIDVLPRHGHGPPQQVVGGRLVIEGMDLLSARDVYTGRVLWKKKFADLGNKDVYYDGTYKDTPLSTAYNQKHIPGANGRGTNYVLTEDKVYVVTADKCRVLDAGTGQEIKQIPMLDAAKKNAQWGFIGVYEDYLIGGCSFADYSKVAGVTKLNTWTKNVDLSGCMELVVFNRHTGKELWRKKSNYSFIHNGIVAGQGRLYTLDRLPKSYEKKLMRRGEDLPDKYNISCFDLKSGKRLWYTTKDIIGSFLNYSKEHDVLLQAGANARDRSKEEAKEGMVAYRGKDGKELWKDLKRVYAGPCILHNKTIITNAAKSVSTGSFDLLTGKAHMVKNPITKQMEPWTFKRNYGCNTVIASEHLLTFRSGAAGFYDLNTHSGTGNFGGFKSSCTSNLVAANGVLNAPDYTRTCSCTYQNQTSLGLIHMPELDYWTTARPGILKDKKQAKEIAFNFGAPGDRIAEDGSLWIDYPSVGGDKIDLPIKVSYDETFTYFSSWENKKQSWIYSSGLKGVESLEYENSFSEAEMTFYFKNHSSASIKFNVLINGKEFLSNFEAAPGVSLSKSIKVRQKGKIKVEFKNITGKSLLNGLHFRFK